MLCIDVDVDSQQLSQLQVTKPTQKSYQQLGLITLMLNLNHLNYLKYKMPAESELYSDNIF